MFPIVRLTRSAVAQTLPLSIAVVATLGCGTIVHGRHQAVRITSRPGGAEVRILPGNKVARTPARVQLSRTEARYGIEFEKEGYEKEKKVVRQKVSWGPQVIHLILIQSGLAGTLIDAMTGGLYRLSPDPVHAELRPLPEDPESEAQSGSTSGGSEDAHTDGGQAFSPLDPYAPRTPAPKTTDPKDRRSIMLSPTTRELQ